MIYYNLINLTNNFVQCSYVYMGSSLVQLKSIDLDRQEQTHTHTHSLLCCYCEYLKVTKASQRG